MLVDWAYAVTGAAWADTLLFLISVAAEGGTDPEQAWNESRLAREADPDDVNALLAAAAGDYTRQSMQPAPPHMPGLRDHQRRNATAAVSWLRSRARRQ